MSANETPWVDRPSESTYPLINESLRAGLALLWRAYVCALETDLSVWDFALRASRLYEAAMTSSDLRWLVAKGYAEHGQEISGYDDPHRSFRPCDNYFFKKHSCLVLTPSGAALAHHCSRETGRAPHATLSRIAAVAGQNPFPAKAQQPGHETDKPETATRKPQWNPTRRELSLAGLIVKRFRVPARNQETILSVFEEEGWAEHIHDPLPVNHDIDGPTRLHDAINRLNRCQVNPLLRFHGDGKGTGVFWELRPPYILG